MKYDLIGLKAQPGMVDIEFRLANSMLLKLWGTQTWMSGKCFNNQINSQCFVTSCKWTEFLDFYTNSESYQSIPIKYILKGFKVALYLRLIPHIETVMKTCRIDLSSFIPVLFFDLGTERKFERTPYSFFHFRHKAVTI